jgi:hypothetical protein
LTLWSRICSILHWSLLVSLSQSVDFEKVDQWNPIRTSTIQSLYRPMRFLDFSNHEKEAQRQEISKQSTFSRSGWSVTRSASLAKGGTSKTRPSPHLHKVPTRSNVSLRTFQTALVLAVQWSSQEFSDGSKYIFELIWLCLISVAEISLKARFIPGKSVGDLRLSKRHRRLTASSDSHHPTAASYSSLTSPRYAIGLGSLLQYYNLGLKLEFHFPTGIWLDLHSDR